jgi:hypothetical protein
VGRACIRFGVMLPSIALCASQGKAGMFDSGTTSRGLLKCRRCHSSE